MRIKSVIYFGQQVALGCDERCEKAWGVCCRPTSGDEYLADDELGLAPVNPGTYEGEDGKPTCPDARPNKWCARQCERSVMVAHREGTAVLPDWSRRRMGPADA